MFDIAWSELALIGVVALVVIGPKDLPKVMRTLGQWTRKARILASEFQHNVDEMIRQVELDDVRRQVQSINPAAVKAKVEDMIGAKDIEQALVVEPPPSPQAGAVPVAAASEAAAPAISESAAAPAPTAPGVAPNPGAPADRQSETHP